MEKLITLGKDVLNRFEKSGVVYKLNCKKFKVTYVRQMGRLLNIRVEHKKNLGRKCNYSYHNVLSDHRKQYADQNPNQNDQNQNDGLTLDIKNLKNLPASRAHSHRALRAQLASLASLSAPRARDSIVALRAPFLLDLALRARSCALRIHLSLFLIF